MTMPDERTRSLRFGRELLLEMEASDCLNSLQRTKVSEILRHYPSADEIKQWALQCQLGADPSGFDQPKLLPEKLRTILPGKPHSPQTIDRGPTTPEERTRALCNAYELFRFGLTGSENENLTDQIRRQIPYVLRHFPTTSDIYDWACDDQHRMESDPSFIAWLLPY